MNEHDMTEQAYKNGYDRGYEDGKRDALKHGRWRFRRNWDFFVCSECSCESSNHSSYCPNCGARMDGEDDG